MLNKVKPYLIIALVAIIAIAIVTRVSALRNIVGLK
jgi:hypothetical protein